MKIHDKSFEPYISETEIKEKIKILASQIKQDYKDKNPLFVCVLNGAFMFASDLLKELDFSLQIEFIKVKSYEGTTTKGNVEWLLDLNEDISGRNIILIEDIVDTGHTLNSIYKVLETKSPNSIKIASLLYKRENYNMPHPIDYFCFEIENKFVVGYGMDYNELGRNIPSILQITN